MSKSIRINLNNQSTFSVPGFFDLLDYAESDQFASRMDALHDGLVDMVDRTRESVAHPWVDLLQSLGTNDKMTDLSN